MIFTIETEPFNKPSCKRSIATVVPGSTCGEKNNRIYGVWSFKIIGYNVVAGVCKKRRWESRGESHGK
jgi:hypothetical protein